MKFQSHVPSSIDVDPAIPKRDFKDLAELLSDPWIAGWNKGEKDFAYYWSKNDGRWSKARLMAMWTKPNGKKEWWVLGYMDEIPTELAEWTFPKENTDP
jgi:hypothetical protein